MDHTSLRVFVAVAERGGLTHAAEQLHMSQPAASLQLKKLQDELAIELFYRTARGMRLTDYGRKLLPMAQRILRGTADLKAAATALQGEVRGELRLGTIVDPEFIRLGALLRTLSQQHAHLAFQLQQGISGQIQRLIEQNQLDVGFSLDVPGFSNVSPDLYALRLSDCHYRVVAPAGWEDQVLGKGWDEISQLPWITTPPDSVHSKLLQAQLKPMDLEVHPAARVDVEPSMLDLVKSGVGLSLVRDGLAYKAAQEHDLVISDQLSLTAELGFFCRADRRDELLIDAAFQAIQDGWLMRGQ